MNLTVMTPLPTEVHIYTKCFYLFFCFFSLNFDFIIGELAKVDGSSSEQKLNTHRSKHSETEQRRRSKINERKAYFFQ